MSIHKIEQMRGNNQVTGHTSGNNIMNNRDGQDEDAEEDEIQNDDNERKKA